MQFMLTVVLHRAQTSVLYYLTYILMTFLTAYRQLEPLSLRMIPIFLCKGRISADIEYKLANIQKWLISNKLTLNHTKTDYMLIGSQQRFDNIIKTPKVLFGEHKVKRVREKNCSWFQN